MDDAPGAARLQNLRWLEADPRPLDWNGPSARGFRAFRPEDLDRPIVELFERVARRSPYRLAMCDADTSITYGQLWDGFSGLAETIAAETAPGELIGILLPASPMFALAMLACLAAGRPFLALDANAAGDWLAQALEDARPSLIIAGKEVPAGAREQSARVIHLTDPPPPAQQGWRPAELCADEPACVLFTSGSTGRPKGIVNSQRGLLQRVAQSINAAHINAEDRLLTLASPGAVVGVRDVLTALLAGASIHLVDPQLVGAQVLDLVRRQAITILFAFPALLRSVLGAGGERAGKALRLVRVGGDTTLWSDIDRLRAWLEPDAAIQLIYAATEAPMMQWFVDDACRTADGRVPIGYPLEGNRLAIVDEAGRAAPTGDAGELIVESPYVSPGLWVDGRCVAEGVEGGGGAGRRIFHTGDLVRQRPDGLLERLGRMDRQVKIRGVRVELDGVEAALRQHPWVRDVGALARISEMDGAASLVAYVSARDGAPGGLLGELKALMGSAPSAMRPSRLYLTDEIPRLASSKLDTSALAALDQANLHEERAGPAAAVALPDSDAIARTAAQIWQDVLHRPVAGSGDDFFDRGGDSLKAITFMIGLERALGLELPLTLINEAPTFSRLCQALKNRRPGRYAPLVLLKAGEGLAPVFLVHGIGGTVSELFPLARAMAYPGAVFGVQARGLARGTSPHASVEAMAGEYLRAIKASQPEGPYHLCGYSFGGLVAFEMARRLAASGEEVGFLGLLDTLTSPLRWPPRLWFAGPGQRTAQARKDRVREGPSLLGLLTSTPARILGVAASGLIASARHRPGFYPAKLTLFTPVSRDPALPSLEAIWRPHAEAVSVISLPGRHLSMLSPLNAASAAAALTDCLPSS